MSAHADPAAFMADPTWAESIPSAPPPTRTRHLPTHEDCAPIDVETVTGHLRAGGTLGRMTGYEERPGQIEMSAAIANAFDSREHLMIEAGTGVGKSLAYLLPAISWAWTNDTPVVISTATRNLQSQLMGADIPRAVGILGDQAKNFRVALLKGRTNYLCLKSVDEYFSAGYWTLPTDEQEEMPGFIAWLLRTPDGDLDTYEGIDRAHLSRPGDECSGRRCPFHAQCFIYKARQRASEAHLIVANHALVLAEAANPGSGILPAYGRLVFDEAHNLEEIATDQLGSEFSLPNLNRILRRLVRHHKEAAPRVAEVSRAADEFLTFLGRLLPPKRDVIRYDAARFYWKDLSRFAELQRAFERPLLELVNALRDFADQTTDADAAVKLEADANRLIAFANEAAFVVAGDKPTHAYWVERVRTERRKTYLRLVAAPLSVAAALQEFFYGPKDSVILSSATLRVGTDFRHMARRLGCGERFKMLTASSPFDYFRQALVLGTDYLPDPSADPTAYSVELSWLLGALLNETHGRMLVLFTSYEMMNAVASCARGPLEEAGFRLLVQGEGASREAMTAALREAGTDGANPPTVLFGAQSFWEGVDIAGEALSCVVLSRLPFAQPTDPIVEARCEQIVRDGGNAFRDYTLPDAIIRFRQGFGRLVRTKRDRGVVIVTDPRLVTKNYGASFRKSLPATVHTVTEAEDLLARVRDFLAC